MADNQNFGITDQSLLARHIASNLADYEAARSSFFVLDINFAREEKYGGDINLLKPNFTGDPADATELNKYNENDLDVIRLNVVKAPVPNYKVGTIDFVRGNDIIHAAGRPEWNTGGQIVVDDIVGVDTKSKLYSWLRLAFDPHSLKGGRMKDYKKTAYLREYTQDYELIRSWRIEGIFITEISESEFDRESSDGKRQLSVNFIYDRALMELPESEAE